MHVTSEAGANAHGFFTCALYAILMCQWGRAVSNVSKSVSVLDFSDKEKAAKPPRRLSIPAKSSVSPLPRPVSSITPISEIRTKKSTSSQGNCDTPAYDASKLTNRRKFSVLSSVSYWISQIKISESAAKHSISLGFFKLALESGCEPFQRLRDELKSYVLRHNLLELGEPTKELLRSYNISEDLEQVQVSETCSLVLSHLMKMVIQLLLQELAI
ncbi:uncharacterized protein LOC143885511 isoform X2 [Tasmannia lanceolata]|uniref:uncharacterized protein LOC143885511 isoform X2 n=1 Tax=Tasmannia lanceolata TaxID=3420 RepID=UPI0040636A69